MANDQKPAGKDAKYEHWRWRIFSVTWLAYAGLYLTRKSFAAAKVALGPGTAIGLSNQQMAGIDTGYSIAYAAGQFVFGAAGDRLGPRRVVLAGMLGSVLAAFAMGGSSTMMTLILFSCVQGLCQATGWAPLAGNLRNFFSQRERGTVMGFWCTSYAVGGWFATIYAGWVGQQFGWRYAFWVPAATLLGVWVLFLWLQRDRPEDAGLPSIEQYHGEAPAKINESTPAAPAPAQPSGVTWVMLKSPMVMILCVVYFCLKPARYLFLFWGPRYIHDTLGSGMAGSALISSTFELGGPLGALLAGIVSDRVFGSRRAPVAVIALLSTSGILFFFDRLPRTTWAIGSVLFLLGVFVYAADSLISGTAAIDFGSKHGAATAAGLVNGSGSIGQIIGPAIPGLVPATWGWGGVFGIVGGMVLIAGLVLVPKWNALPAPTTSNQSS